MLGFRRTNIFFILTMGATTVLARWFLVPFWVYGAVAFLWFAILTYGSVVLSAQFFTLVRCRGNPSSGAVAITFDDGPIAGKTEKVLEILKAHNAMAAFFCIGNRIKEHPSLAMKIHEAGHLIGNHSYWHKNTFDLQSTEKIENELRETNIAIEQATGVKPNFFRPPYGVTTPMVAGAIVRLGLKTIGWSIRSFDTISKDPRLLLGRVTKKLRAGDIVLFHDYCAITLEILPAFLDHVAQSGLKIVRLDELVGEKAYATTR